MPSNAALHPLPLSKTDGSPAPVPARGARSGAAAFRVEALSADRFRERSQALIAEGALYTAFQHPQWLEVWLATLGQQPGLWPVFLAVTDAAKARDLLMLPLVAQRSSGVTMLRAPDLGVADYHWPLLAADAQLGTEGRNALWTALKPALARRGDLLRLAKMLPDCEGVPHPLVGPLPVWPSESTGHRFDISQGHAAWSASLSRQARREFARHWRLFSSAPGARFERVTDASQAQFLLSELDRLQGLRLGHQAAYRLGEPVYQSFYARLLQGGLANGSVVMTSLRAGEETVAVAYGLRKGKELTLVRVAIGEARWKPCAPGLLLMERTAELMSHDGVSEVDLSIGSFDYKRSFRCVQRPLLESCVPLTWRGGAMAAAWQTRQRLASLANPAGERDNVAPCQEPNSNS